MTTYHNLPPETILDIATYLSTKSLLRYTLTSHSHHTLLLSYLHRRAHCPIRELTYLQRACHSSEPSHVALLLRLGVNPNSHATRSMPPLHIAALKTNAEIVTMLLEAGADANIISSYRPGWTPLIFALSSLKIHTSDTVTIVRLLLAHGAAETLYATCIRRFTAAHYVMYNGNKGGGVREMLRAMVEKGLDVRRGENRSFGGLLHFAAHKGCREGVEELVAMGAQVTSVDVRGRTPREVAYRAGNQDVGRLLWRLEQEERRAQTEKERGVIELTKQSEGDVEAGSRM